MKKKQEFEKRGFSLDRRFKGLSEMPSGSLYNLVSRDENLIKVVMTGETIDCGGEFMTEQEFCQKLMGGNIGLSAV